MVHMYHRRGREGGIYHCEIPDAMHVTQTIFIGVYLATTGEYSGYVADGEIQT